MLRWSFGIPSNSLPIVQWSGSELVNQIGRQQIRIIFWIAFWIIFSEYYSPLIHQLIRTHSTTRTILDCGYYSTQHSIQYSIQHSIQPLYYSGRLYAWQAGRSYTHRRTAMIHAQRRSPVERARDAYASRTLVGMHLAAFPHTPTIRIIRLAGHALQRFVRFASSVYSGLFARCSPHTGDPPYRRRAYCLATLYWPPTNGEHTSAAICNRPIYGPIYDRTSLSISESCPIVLASQRVCVCGEIVLFFFA